MTKTQDEYLIIAGQPVQTDRRPQVLAQRPLSLHKPFLCGDSATPTTIRGPCCWRAAALAARNDVI
jgi:hypothetical protein